MTGVQTCALPIRSEEHTSELQSPRYISYAVFCLPGFQERELAQWLADAGFVRAETSIVARERAAPRFQTLLALAEKPGRKHKAHA